MAEMNKFMHIYDKESHKYATITLVYAKKSIWTKGKHVE